MVRTRTWDDNGNLIFSSYMSKTSTSTTASPALISKNTPVQIGSQAKIVHGYSQISLLVAMQIMPCSCKIHAMNMHFFVSSCPWTVIVHAFDPYNNDLCAWSKGMTSCAWEYDSCAWNIGLKPLFIPSSCHEHAWTGHEQGMNCAWNYHACRNKKHEIWAKIPKFHGCW